MGRGPQSVAGRRVRQSLSRHCLGCFAVVPLASRPGSRRLSTSTQSWTTSRNQRRRLWTVVEEQQAKVADPPIDAEIVQGLVQALSAMHKQIEFLKACCQELSLSITQMASVNMETIDAMLRLHPGA